MSKFNIFFYCLISVTQFLPLLLFSQKFTVENFKESNPNFNQDIYEFPILQGSNTKVINRVNEHIVLNILDIEYGKQLQSIFENVWRDKENPVAPINYLTYNVNYLTDEVYSVTISGEWCGAYCEGFETTLNFNLTSGDVITLQSLVNENTYNLMLDEFNLNKTTIIAEKLNEINEILETKIIDEEQVNVLTVMKELYENCTTNYESLNEFDFIINPEELVIVGEKCSLHHNRAIDELGEFKMAFKVETFKNELTDLGKSFFFE